MEGLGGYAGTMDGKTVTTYFRILTISEIKLFTGEGATSDDFKDSVTSPTRRFR